MSACPFASRRGFLGAALGAMAAVRTASAQAASAPASGQASSGRAASGQAASGQDIATEKGISAAAQGAGRGVVEPFWGDHQGGILTPLQNHSYFAAFDLLGADPAALVRMLRDWTAAAARMSTGKTASDAVADVASDTGEALGLAPARLTVTFGFGAGLFDREGLGLAARRPTALVALPRFNGDQLVPERTGGDLSVQAWPDDPQVAFHAIRQMARLGDGVVRLRWAQTGFSAGFAADDTPRNLMGFKDGTQNPIARRPAERTGGVVEAYPGDADAVVWAGEEAPAWMRGGSYVVARRIRIALEHWDRTETEFQEEVIGRHKLSGAPLGGKGEFDPLDLDAMDGEGNPVIPEDAHVRLAAAASNGGAQILRRSYSYDDGLSFVAERWPPWRQGMQFDAGLFFVAYQRDVRSGFAKIFEPMSKLDALNQFATHVGGGLFACPGGMREGEFIGQGLFEA